MLSPASRSRTAVNIWPGFVDALASVLLVFIFMLLIFVVAQFYLAELASNRYGAIDQLSTNIHALLDELSLEKDRRESLDRDVAALRQERAALRSNADSLSRRLSSSEQELSAERDRGNALEQQALQIGNRLASRNARIEELGTRFLRQDASLSEARRMGADATRDVARLNEQLVDLRRRMGSLSAALQVSQRTSAGYKLEVDELGRKLNLALAERVEELSRFRSDFFGRMREVLGERDDIQIAGVRFVFQSEVLFSSGSAALEPRGQVQLDRLAKTLKSVAEQIPPDVDWILRVDGHTDRRPIRTAGFPSNWELSSARALSIVRHLMQRGIPPRRLAAAAFAEFRPVDDGESEEALARNRRIEIKVTGP